MLNQSDYRKFLTAALALVGLTLLMMHPFFSLKNFFSHIPLGDAATNAYILSWICHALKASPSHLYEANIFFPQTLTLAYTDAFVGLGFMMFPFSFLSANVCFLYNLAILLPRLLSALFMYLLCYHYSRCSAASLLGAIVFSFNSDVVWHSAGHPNILATMWLPLLIYLLELNFERPRYYLLAIFSVLLWLQILSSWYLAVFVLLLTVSFSAFRAIERRKTLPKKWLAGLALAFVLAVAAAYPFSIPYQKIAERNDAWRSPGEMIEHSADPLGYILPPIEKGRNETLTGKLLSKQIEGIARTGENNQFLGYLVILLCSAAIFSLVRTMKAHEFSDRERTATYYVFLIIVAGILSLGPFLSFGKQYFAIRLPWYYVYAWLPPLRFMRSIARFSVLVYFGAGVLCAIYVSIYAARFHNAWIRRIFLALLIIIACFEYYSVSPPEKVEFRYSETAKWLAGQPQPLPYVEIPVNDSLEYLLDSTLHWHRLVNGYIGGSRNVVADEQRKILSSFPSPRSLLYLSKIGVNTCVVYTPYDGMLKRYEGFVQQVAEFNEVGMYHIRQDADTQERLRQLLAIEQEAYQKEREKLRSLHPEQQNVQFTFQHSTMGWRPSTRIVNFGAKNGVLGGKTIDSKSFLMRGFEPPLIAPIYEKFVVRMKLSKSPSKADIARLYWRSPGEDWSDFRSIMFRTTVDGEFHNYVLDLSPASPDLGDEAPIRKIGEESSVKHDLRWAKTLEVDSVVFMPYAFPYPGARFEIEEILFLTE